MKSNVAKNLGALEDAGADEQKYKRKAMHSQAKEEELLKKTVGAILEDLDERMEKVDAWGQNEGIRNLRFYFGHDLKVESERDTLEAFPYLKAGLINLSRLGVQTIDKHNLTASGTFEAKKAALRSALAALIEQLLLTEVKKTYFLLQDHHKILLQQLKGEDKRV